MTGFYSLTEQVKLPSIGNVAVSVEIKTLNSRFFEVVAKMPSCLSYLELPLTTMLQEKLIRGRVYLNIRFDNKQNGFEVVSPSWQAIEQYLSAVKAIKAKHPVSGELSIADLIRLPNVLVAQENPLWNEDAKLLTELVAKVADIVARMRTEEGNRLEKDFAKIFKSCADKIAIVQKEFDIIINKYKEELRQAMEENSKSEQPDPHIEELQITLRKTDIHEELTRFKSHLASVDPILNSASHEKGKRLDFILQELMRETNTMMAKCPAYQVGTVGIDIKVELEKAREQVQNIV
jgi:uncharacterized protein (TIGR00255 family)